uniref:Uncharacterized protein n=1 Tax=Anguilla anguilla TaxID=7936 RepID=A0A0E9VKL1_ANGAN
MKFRSSADRVVCHMLTSYINCFFLQLFERMFERIKFRVRFQKPSL